MRYLARRPSSLLLRRALKIAIHLLRSDVVNVSTTGLIFFWSGALDLDLHVDIVARGVRIGTDLLVRFLGECRQLGSQQARILHLELDRKPEPAAVARADRYLGGDTRLACILLVLFADEVERAAEAGGIAGGKQVLRRCGAGLAGSAHRLRHRKGGAHRAVGGLGMAVASADRGGAGSEKRLDRIHDAHSKWRCLDEFDLFRWLRC